MKSGRGIMKLRSAEGVVTDGKDAECERWRQIYI